MKVLILQGSPRTNGNTAWMAEEYKKAAEAAGHEVTLVNGDHGVGSSDHLLTSELLQTKRPSAGTAV